jgi:hypothetical protein
LSTASDVAGPLRSIAKEKSCGCYVKAVESVKLRQFSQGSLSVFHGTESSTVICKPLWMTTDFQSFQASEYVATATALPQVM